MFRTPFSNSSGNITKNSINYNYLISFLMNVTLTTRNMLQWSAENTEVAKSFLSEYIYAGRRSNRIKSVTCRLYTSCCAPPPSKNLNSFTSAFHVCPSGLTLSYRSCSVTLLRIVLSQQFTASYSTCCNIQQSRVEETRCTECNVGTINEFALLDEYIKVYVWT